MRKYIINDREFCFLRTGKQLYSKYVNNSPQLLDLFSSLGESWNRTKDLMNALKHFVRSILQSLERKHVFRQRGQAEYLLG